MGSASASSPGLRVWAAYIGRCACAPCGAVRTGDRRDALVHVFLHSTLVSATAITVSSGETATWPVASLPVTFLWIVELRSGLRLTT